LKKLGQYRETSMQTPVPSISSFHTELLCGRRIASSARFTRSQEMATPLIWCPLN
jgi:hypothetical protein